MWNNKGELNFENSRPQVLFLFRKPDQVTILVGQTINIVVRLILVCPSTFTITTQIFMIGYKMIVLRIDLSGYHVWQTVGKISSDIDQQLIAALRWYK